MAHLSRNAAPILTSAKELSARLNSGYSQEKPCCSKNNARSLPSHFEDEEQNVTLKTPSKEPSVKFATYSDSIRKEDIATDDATKSSQRKKSQNNKASDSEMKRSRKRKLSQKRSLKKRQRMDNPTPEVISEWRLKCYFCFKIFQRYSDLRKHLLIHTQEKHHTCTACKKQFTRKSHLTIHIFDHLTPEEKEKEMETWRHPCQICGKRFKIQSTLYSHITRIHTKEKHYQCKECKKEFNRQDHLTTHIRLHSEDPATRRPFKCLQCEKTFTEKRSLTVHQKSVHLGIKPFPCPQCPKYFSRKSALTSHLFLHLTPEEKALEMEGWKHSCTFCGARFKIESALNLHIIGVHTIEKHFPCPQCKAEFRQQGDLTTHRRIHSEDPSIRRPFKCPQCEKSFTVKGDVARHQKAVHLGMKPFPCPQCDKQFSRKSDMTKHIDAVHSKIRHPCAHCSKTFSTKGHARSHEKKEH